MIEGEGGQGRWRREVKHHAALLCAYDGLVELTDPFWLQGVFYTLTRLFDRLGIWKNVRKTVGTIFCPCCAAGTHLEAS